MSRIIRFIIASILFVGCVNRHKSTVKLCDGKLYVEIFNINLAGVDEEYLTDSIKYRIYIGKFDNEHEWFSYICKGDSIKIIKFVENTRAGKKKLDSLVISFTDLINKDRNSNPLFKFK